VEIELNKVNYIPILDGEEWDLSLAIDQHQSSNLTQQVKQEKSDDVNE
jgi:hypothetical protein